MIRINLQKGKACELCGATLRSDNVVGICKRNPECKRAAGRKLDYLNRDKRRAQKRETYHQRNHGMSHEEFMALPKISKPCRICGAADNFAKSDKVQ